MIASARVKNGKSIHKAIDMGGFLYIACHVDPTTMKTEKVHGEVTCKKCLGLKNAVSPNYLFAKGNHVLMHPFCRTNNDNDGFGAGWHDGRENLNKYLPNGLSDDIIRGYNEGYYEGQQNYSYHYKNGNVKDKPLAKVPLKNFDVKHQATQPKKTDSAYVKKSSNSTLGKLIRLFFSRK